MTGLRILLGLAAGLAAHPSQKLVKPGSPEEASLIELASRVDEELLKLKDRVTSQGLPWHVDSLNIPEMAPAHPPGSLAEKAEKLFSEPMLEPITDHRVPTKKQVPARTNQQAPFAVPKTDPISIEAQAKAVSPKALSEFEQLEKTGLEKVTGMSEAAVDAGLKATGLTPAQAMAQLSGAKDQAPLALVNLRQSSKQKGVFWIESDNNKDQSNKIGKLDHRNNVWLRSVMKWRDRVGLTPKAPPVEFFHKKGSGSFAVKLKQIEDLAQKTHNRLDLADKEWKKIEKRQQHFEQGDKGIAYRMKVWTDEVEDFYNKALKGIMKHNDMIGDFSRKAPLTQNLVNEMVMDEWGMAQKIDKAMRRKLKITSKRLKKKLERIAQDNIDENGLFKEVVKDFSVDMPLLTTQVMDDIQGEFTLIQERALKLSKDAKNQMVKGMKIIGQAMKEKDRQRQSFDNSVSFTNELMDKVDQFVHKDEQAEVLNNYKDMAKEQIEKSATGASAAATKFSDGTKELMSATDDEEKGLADGVVARGEQRLNDFKTLAAELTAAVQERTKGVVDEADKVPITQGQIQDKQTQNLKLGQDAQNDWLRGAKTYLQDTENGVMTRLWKEKTDGVTENIDQGQSTGRALAAASLVDAADWKKKQKAYVEDKLTEMLETNHDQAEASQGIINDYEAEFGKVSKKHMNDEGKITIDVDKKISDARVIKHEKDIALEALHKESTALVPDPELLEGPKRSDFVDRTRKMETDLTKAGTDAKLDLEKFENEFKGQLQTMTGQYAVEANQKIEQTKEAMGRAKTDLAKNTKDMQLQRVDFATLKKQARETKDTEAELKMNLAAKMEDAALKTNTTGQDMATIAKEVIDGAAQDVRVDEQSAFNMMTRNQDPVWHKADDAINGERHKLQALSSSVSTGIAQQKKVASGFGGRASSYSKAVDTFGPSSQEMLDAIGGKINALQEAVKGYGPSLTAKAKENYDKLWGDVEEALKAFKDRNANLDSEEALALYEKLKKMRPEDLDLSDQYDTVVESLQDGARIAALRDNFTATAQAAEEVEKNGLEKAEQNAWKAASQGGEGMQEISKMLDGIAGELHAKAHMADAVANGVGQKLMGKVLDANRAAERSGQDVANSLQGAMSEAEGLEGQAHAGIAAENALGKGSGSSLSMALKGLLGTANQADRFFMVLQHGEERQKSLRAKWLATVVTFVSQLAASLDPDFEVPTGAEDGTNAALGNAAQLAAGVVAAGNDLVHAAEGASGADIKRAVDAAGKESIKVAGQGNAENKLVEDLVLGGVKAAASAHKGDVKAIGGLVNKLRDIVGHLPAITKVAEQLDDVSGDAQHYIDFLDQHSGDPVAAAKGMERAMERDIKDALSEEEKMLQNRKTGVNGQNGLPSVHFMDLNKINQQASSSVSGDRAAMMQNMERSMASFNDFAGREMSDEGAARGIVAEEENAAFNQVDHALADYRREDRSALMGASSEQQSAGRKLVDLEKRTDLLTANVERLRDSAMAFNVAAPMDMKTAEELHKAAQALHEVDPLGDTADATASLAQIPDQLRKEAAETPQDIDRMTTLESMMQKLDSELS